MDTQFQRDPVYLGGEDMAGGREGVVWELEKEAGRSPYIQSKEAKCK